jgi:hypothetical protein
MSKDFIREVGYLKVNKNGKRLLEIKEDFEVLFKNNICLQDYADFLNFGLDKGFIKEDEYQRKIKKSTANGGDIGYVLNLPPQEERGDEPAIPSVAKGWKRKALEVKQNKEHVPYISAKFDVSLKAGDVIWLDNFEEAIRNNDKLSDERKDEILEKYKNEDGEGFWLMYTADVGPEDYRAKKREEKKQSK